MTSLNGVMQLHSVKDSFSKMWLSFYLDPPKFYTNLSALNLFALNVIRV